MDDEDGLLVGFVAVFESIDVQGERHLHVVYPDEQAVWQSEGYLKKVMDWGVDWDEDDDE